MPERPIIFSAPMIRALLREAERPDTGKTQTRRLFKLQPVATDCVFRDRGGSWYVTDSRCEWISELRIPHAPGDRLYVREAHALLPASAYRMSDGVDQVVNPADRDQACVFRQGFDRSSGGIRWRPSIHMPRWASRLTLTVTDVRVQRLQDISDADARAEGVSMILEDGPADAWFSGLRQTCDFTDGDMCGWHHNNAVAAYRDLWNSLHGPDAWGANQWVAAISFTVRKGNIDA